jgi:hypothetical protein
LPRVSFASARLNGQNVGAFGNFERRPDDRDAEVFRRACGFGGNGLESPAPDDHRHAERRRAAGDSWPMLPNRECRVSGRQAAGL